MRHASLPTLLVAAGLLAGCAGGDLPTAASADLAVPSFAHESNNRGELSGTQNGNTISGQAIINYAKGAPKEWRSTVNVKGNLAAGTYTFAANLVIPSQGGVQPGQFQEICTFTVSGNGGRQGCSADTDLEGFSRVFILDSDGNIVAEGAAERRGGQRFP